jgi:glycosyltransferase involved in cell wall biosynthesis
MESEITHSVVIPVYQNSESIDQLFESLLGLADSIEGYLEAVFVVDGSPDDSALKLFARFPNDHLSLQILQLSRNFGAFAAIRVGLEVARGNYIAVIAADLQEPPELLRSFFDKLQNESCDIVIGRRTARQDALISSFAARTYWRFYTKMINRDIPSGGVDVFACNKVVAKQLTKLSESNTSLVGLLFWVGFRRDFVDYTRLARQHGKSGWTVKKKFEYLTDSIFAFTNLPIVLLQLIGILGIGISTALGVVVLIGSINGSIAAPGYATLMIVVLASSSAILLGLGVVGSYAWRAYENGKSRPTAITMKHDVG